MNIRERRLEIARKQAQDLRIQKNLAQQIASRKRLVSPQNIQTVLIVLFGAVGDAILGSTVLKNIKQSYPGCQIHWLILKDYYNVISHNIVDVDKWLILESFVPSFLNSEKAYFTKQPILLKTFLEQNTVHYDSIVVLVGPDRKRITSLGNHNGNQTERFLEACNRQLPISKNIRTGSFVLTNEDKELWEEWSKNIDTKQKYICSEMFARSAGPTLNNWSMINLAHMVYKTENVKTIFMHSKSDRIRAKEFYDLENNDGSYIMCDLPLGAATYGINQVGRVFVSYCTGQTWAVCATNRSIPIVEVLNYKTATRHPEIGAKFNPFGQMKVTSLVTTDIMPVYNAIKSYL